MEKISMMEINTLTVGEIIEILSQFPRSMSVCVSDKNLKSVDLSCIGKLTAERAFVDDSYREDEDVEEHGSSFKDGTEHVRLTIELTEYDEREVKRVQQTP